MTRRHAFNPDVWAEAIEGELFTLEIELKNAIRREIVYAEYADHAKFIQDAEGVERAAEEVSRAYEDIFRLKSLIGWFTNQLMAHKNIETAGLKDDADA